MSNLFNNPDNLVDMVRQVLSGKPIEEKEQKVAAYDKKGKQVGLYKNMADAKRLKPGHTYKPHKEELDPVGKEDGDIDNDGDTDASDKYLKNRRKKIAKAMNEEEPCPKCGKVHINASHCMEEVELEEAVLAGRDYKVKDGKVHISKANFKKISKDYKNDTRGKERMVVLDPKTHATVSMPVVFEETELDEAFKKGDKVTINVAKSSEPEMQQLRKKLGDTISGIVMGQTGRILMVKTAKGQVNPLVKDVMKEEVELDEAKDEDSDGEKMTDAQKKDMDGDGEKDKGEKKKKKKKDDEDDEPKADKINTEPETDEVKTMMSEDEMTPAQKTRLDKMKKKYEGGEMHKAMKAKYGDKADEVFYGKLTKMAMGEAVEMNENRTGYNKDSVDKAIKRDPRIKGKEAKAIHALLKGRSAKNRKEEVDMDEANDEEKDTNLIMQLRKAVSLRGNKVKFADGKSVVVSDKDAQKFMSMFSKLKKPVEKEMMMKSAAKSPKHFKMALSGRVENPKSGGPDLPKMKSEK